MVCRDPGRGEAALAEVRQRVPGASAELLLADFSRLAEVEALVGEVSRRTDRLDVLVSNAGVFSARRRLSDDGLELTFAVNHLAPFVLVRGLLGLLRQSAPARVVVVASGAHRRGTIDFDDLQAEHGYGGWRAYSQSKLANVLFARELARRVPAREVTANALHPGVVATKLLLRGIVPGWLARPWTVTPAEGARTSVFVASATEVAGVTGRYFDDCREKEPSREAQNEEVADRLWRVSEQLTRTGREQKT
jgi:NAD(P)-dependent dehydrogenase (short-subunit alcohol dehydrogenase family)